MITFKQVTEAVKTFIRNLPTIRKEIVAAATAGATMVGTFEVTFPQVSTAHLAFFSTVTAVLTGAAVFLSNNRVVDELSDFSSRPVWKAKLTYLVKGKT